MSTARFLVGDVHDRLAELPDDSVDLVFTSSPFLSLRSYLAADHPDKHKEMGSEANPGAFLDALLDVVEALDRVLAPHGTLCMELGDTYANQGGQAQVPSKAFPWREAGWAVERGENGRRLNNGRGWPENKSLCAIPALLQVALAYGLNPLTGRTTPRWRVRNLHPWCRPNPPVGALGDKWRPATSYVLSACKGGKRYFDLDAVREPGTSFERPTGRGTNGGQKMDPALDQVASAWHGKKASLPLETHPGGAPPLDWLNIPTQPYKGAHYATFPTALVTPFVRCMCPERVCRVCGKPSERILQAVPHGAWQQEIAAHLQERREAKGLTRKDVAAHFPSRTGGITGCVTNWESAFNVPTAEQWRVLKSLLDLSDEFDELVDGERRWCESTVEYEHLSDNPSGLTQDAGGALYRRLSATKARISPVGWSDCGHNTWRRGMVLDPFAGSGTVLEVATGNGRDAIGIDLDERNLELARERVGMFLEEVV